MGVVENEKERVDRELIELLNELRVALPGVQVLFAFLLLLPFQQGFVDATPLERSLYSISFLGAAAASVLLIAPSTYHRVHFREGDKEEMLMTSNRLLLAGTACLAVAIATAAFLVAARLYGEAPGLLVALVIGALLAWFWYGLPIVRKIRVSGRLR
jgi:hypothetical protein